MRLCFRLCLFLAFATSIETSTVCRGDLVLVVDWSITGVNYASLKKLLVQLTNSFLVDQNNWNKISLVTYTNEVKKEFTLDTYNNNRDIASHIRSLFYYYHGDSNTSGALTVVKDEILTEEKGDRLCSPDVVILFTDGINNMGGDPTNSAKYLKQERKAVVVSVALGLFLDTRTLQNIAHPTGSYYTFAEFAQVGSKFVDYVNSITCTPEYTLDIAFIIDESESVGSGATGAENFRLVRTPRHPTYVSLNMKGFQIKEAMQYATSAEVITVSQTENRVGWVGFSTTIHTEPDQVQLLDEATNNQQTHDAINLISFHPGGSNAVSAFEFARDVIFNSSNGDRPTDICHRDLLILISDGNYGTWDQPDPAYIPAQQLLTKGVLNYAVAVAENGHFVDFDNLNKITGDSSHVFNISKYEDVGEVLKEIILGINCLTVPTVCQGDLVFIVDRSESVDDGNFATLKNFLVGLINYFPVDGENLNKLALVSFSDDVKIEFNLNEFNNSADVAKRISEMIYHHPAATNTAGALQTVLTQIFTSQLGDRVCSPDVVILFTDGIHDVGEDPSIPADLLKQQKNAVIVSVGIGPLVEDSELQGISGPTGMVYHFEDFSHLGTEFVDFVKTQICPPDTTSTATFTQTTTKTTTANSIAGNICPDADLVFLVDVSDAPYKFIDYLKKFVSHLSERYMANSFNSRVAIGIFSRKYQVVINFDKGYAWDNVNNAINDNTTWPSIPSLRDTRLGLQSTIDNVLNPTTNRPDVGDKVIVVDFGDYQDAPGVLEPFTVAEAIRNRLGTSVYGFAAQQVSLRDILVEDPTLELTKIVNNPAHIKIFDNMNQLIDDQNFASLLRILGCAGI